MNGREISIPASDGGEFSAYRAEPDGGGGPGIVIIQEIFGVNEVMRRFTDWFAERGFVAVAPDLFWRQEPDVRIDQSTDPASGAWDKAFALARGFDQDLGVTDVAATLEALRADQRGSGKVAAVGYCMGGCLAFLAATRTKADAAVSYFGVGMQDHLDESVRCPLMVHIGTADEHLPTEVRDRIRAALDPNPRAHFFEYAGAGHAFTRKGAPGFHAAAAKQANTRTLEFLNVHLN